MDNKDPTLAGRVFISDLDHNTKPGLVVGIVINKNEAKTITTKKGDRRHLLTFIIKDSPISSITCNCWGSKDYIDNLSTLFTIGDIVDIRNCQCNFSTENENQMKYKPYTSSPLQLIASERQGIIAKNIGNLQPCFNTFMNVPAKPQCNILKLERVVENVHQLEGEHIDLLVVYKKMANPRQLTTKTGKVLTKSEITVGDDTTDSFTIQIWDAESISFIQSWTPRETVILAQDVKIYFDQFRKRAVGSADGKTVFTVNPDTREAHILYLFAQSLAADEIEFNDSNLDDIRNVYTAKNVLDQFSLAINPWDKKFRGILFAALTKMDLDNSLSITSILCKCGRLVFQNQCSDVNCSVRKNLDTPSTVQQLDLRISLSDHTGTLTTCRLCGPVAEAFLGCTIDDVLAMNESERTALKWKFLFERFKFHFQAFYRTSNSSIIIRILKGERADIAEWCSNFN